MNWSPMSICIYRYRHRHRPGDPTKVPRSDGCFDFIQHCPTQLMNHNQSSLLDKYKQALLSAGQYDALRVLEHAHLLPDTVSAQAHRGPAQGRPATAVEDPSPSATSGSSPKRRKSAPFVACTLCRRCKAKCIKSDPSSSQCDRCRETGCVCIYERHRRGRKRWGLLYSALIHTSTSVNLSYSNQ